MTVSPHQDLPEYIPTHEAAEILGVSPSTLAAKYFRLKWATTGERPKDRRWLLSAVEGARDERVRLGQKGVHLGIACAMERHAGIDPITGVRD